MRKSTLQAIFFDFDGVLVDSNGIKTAAFRTLFSDYSAEIVEQVIRYHRLHGGISRVEKIAHAYREIIGKPLDDDQVDRRAAIFSDLVKQKVVTADFIPGALEFLLARRGTVPIFVISGTPESELTDILKQRNMTEYFREILGSPVKKSVHISNLLARYRLTASSCVFVGDALTDSDSARGCGLQFIGIQGEVTFPKGTRVLPDCRGLESTLGDLFCSRKV